MAINVKAYLSQLYVVSTKPFVSINIPDTETLPKKCKKVQSKAEKTLRLSLNSQLTRLESIILQKKSRPSVLEIQKLLT